MSDIYPRTFHLVSCVIGGELEQTVLDTGLEADFAVFKKRF